MQGEHTVEAMVSRGLSKAYRTGAGPVRWVDGIELEARRRNGDISLIYPLPSRL